MPQTHGQGSETWMEHWEEQPQALWNIPEVHSPDPFMVEAPARTCQKSLKHWYGTNISNCIFSDHCLPLCKVHRMDSVRKPLFPCFSSTNVTKNAAQFFYFWNHQLQLFQSIIITKHAVSRLWDDRGQSFSDFFPISQLIFQINLTIHPLITKEAVDFDGTRLQSLLATLVTSSVQLPRGCLMLETLAQSCGLINQGTALKHQGVFINRIHLKRWSKGLFFPI